MPYVRQRGNQVAIVHGGRHPETGKVEQRILFTLYSKAEAREAIGQGSEGGGFRFRGLLERQHPDLKFNWKEIEEAIAENQGALPDLYEYKAERLHKHFRRDLLALTKQLILADPQLLFSSANLIRDHRHELGFLAELIQWRLRLCEQERDKWNDDNPFYWRFSMQGACVPPEAEEQAAGYYERGDYDRAAAVFRVLLDCFDDYAEGYNYLGLIAYRQHDLEAAAGHFQKTVEVGRRLFPKRIAKSRYWSDLSTRPYMRGLRNLVMTFNELSRYDEALELCDRLENECDDGIAATAYRASIYLNTGRWQDAADAATRLHKTWASEGFTAAFALFELGQNRGAAAMFLYAALNHPRAAKMLLGMRTGDPKDHEQARDHNLGVDELRSLHCYLAQQSRRAKKFFRDLARHPRTEALLTEVVEVVARRNAQHPTGEREAFDRMQLMHTPEFARTEARAIIEEMKGTGEQVALH
jgi:tetratricopeptide (TPR) repeat protein